MLNRRDALKSAAAGAMGLMVPGLECCGFDPDVVIKYEGCYAPPDKWHCDGGFILPPGSYSVIISTTYLDEGEERWLNLKT